MRFILRQAGRDSERIGCLTEFSRLPGVSIDTPTSALLTQGASVVHLTADVLGRVFTNPQLLWVPLSNTIHMEIGLKAMGEGLARFAAVPEHITCMTLHSNGEVLPSGHFEVDRVPLWTKNGKKMITAERYMKLMEVFKPDMILAVADDHISLEERTKRIAKSVERTSNMLEICVLQYKCSSTLQESALIGVIIGSAQGKKRDESIQSILKYKDDLKGVALAGITDAAEDSLKVSSNKMESIFKQINEALPKNLVRIVEGSWNPAVVVTAVGQGWDMFDGSYPLKLTNAGQALVLNFDIFRNIEELCILNLKDVRYKEDFSPILPGCECLACKKHIRAYIRHLLNTREMQAHVLLNIHNLHHFNQLFVHCREHIAAQTFAIFKRHIIEQYEAYELATLTNEATNNGQSFDGWNGVRENGDRSETLRRTKKIRVSNDHGI